MAGTFAKWYWSDWRQDIEVHQCSAAARGVWMELLCIAGLSRRPGHVLINGKKPTIADIKHAGGLHESEAEIGRLIQELVDRGVCDQDRDGIIVCRRIVRDHRRRQISSAGGKSRQKQIIENKDERSPGTRRNDQPPESRSQESISQKPEANQLSLTEKLRKVDKVGKALGIDLTTHRRGPGMIGDVLLLEEAGIDLDLDLIPCIEELRNENRIPRDLSSLMYFKKMALARKEGRALAVIAEKRAAEEADTFIRNATKEQWTAVAKRFLDDGWWNPQYGPSPLKEGCRFPAKAMTSLEKYWNEQGQRPERWWDRDMENPTPFFGSNVVVMPQKAAL